MAKFAKGARVTGPARTKLADDVAKQYAKGKSIRELAEKNGRSYGFVHRLLVENNVKLRGRGGATRGKTRSSSKA
jgi:predicted transcriptional regulator